MFKAYKNGNYNVMINTNTGTKIRFTKQDNFKPNFPESIDCNITYKCNNKCGYCYLGCTEDGKHADLMGEKTIKFIDSLHPYTELALNGNNLDIPNFKEFLEYIKSKEIIANLTLDVRDVFKNISYIKMLFQEDLIKGLGISIHKIEDVSILDLFDEYKNGIVFHIILGLFSYEEIMDLINKNIKILVLGYKEKGRGIEFIKDDPHGINKTTIDHNIDDFKKQLPEFISKIWHYMKKTTIIFDNLAMEQIDLKTAINNDILWDYLYMGDEGAFTFYVDLVNYEFGISSSSNDMYGLPDWPIEDIFKLVQHLRMGNALHCSM